MVPLASAAMGDGALPGRPMVEAPVVALAPVRSRKRQTTSATGSRLPAIATPSQSRMDRLAAAMTSADRSA